jgi:hypothetical protein
MKKTLLIALFSAAAVGAYAQGTVIFSDNAAGVIVSHIWSPQLDGSAQSGNSSIDTPAGSTVYTGQRLGGSATGAVSPTDYSNGNLWSVQLFAAPGNSAALGSLLPVTQYVSTLRTISAIAGTFTPVSPANDAGIPNTAGAVATLSLAAWYNAGNTITSLSAAQAAQVPWGQSPTFVLSALGEPAGAGPSTPAENLIGLQSFSVVSPVPEPSTIALGVMGISAFLIRRRK